MSIQTDDPAGLDGDRRAIVLDVLAQLDRAGVPYALRNGDLTLDDPAADLDVLVRPRTLRALDRTMVTAGWARLRAPGHRGHRFYLREAADRTWVKLDVVTLLRYGNDRSPTGELVDRRRRVDGVWLASEQDAHQHAEHRAAGRREVPTRAERLARALPVSVRRRGCVVAVLGPDGAGKGTVTAALADSLPVGVTQVYLGDRRAQTPAAANAGTVPDRPAAVPGGAVRTAREIAFLLRKLAGWTPSLLRAEVAAWRGHVVLADRHPLDAVAVRPRRTPVAGAVERFLATRVVPKPDAVVVLDAPGEVLYRRKGEHTPERLEQWRQGYRDRLVPRGATLLDATGSIEDTVAQARHVLWQALARRRGWPGS
jgi:thymidylate kinase